MTDPALKVSQSLYCFTTSISHGVENYFHRLWGTGISAIFSISPWQSLYTSLTVYGYNNPVNIRNIFKRFKCLQNVFKA